MIVIDTSALVAIIRREPERAAFAELVANAQAVSASAVTWMECRMVVLSRQGEQGILDLLDLARRFNLQIVPVSRALSDGAFAAFRRFGKGRHPAGLNFGDCFAYALATDFGAPLLYKGNDFARTDVIPAMA